MIPVCDVTYAYLSQKKEVNKIILKKKIKKKVSDVAGLELHCNDHTQAAVRNYIDIYINIYIYIERN